MAMLDAAMVEEKGTLESRIMGLAISGKLARIGRRAVRAQRAMGLPVTFQRGNRVVRQHSDGTVEILDTVARVPFQVPPGVKRFNRP